MKRAPMKIVCVVLAGGEGRRMGGAKPLAAYGAGTLIGRALELAHGYADAVAVAVREPSQVGEVSAPVILDAPGIDGPLAGLAAALAHAEQLAAEAVLTLPCDAPRLPADLAERLVAALAAAADAGAALPISSGDLHPDCGLWRASAQARLPAYLATAARSLRGFAAACGTVTVEWPSGPLDPFANANTPEQLALLRGDGRS